MYGSSAPRIARATNAPWALACSVCSTRIRRPPCTTLAYSHTSPGGPDARRARPQALVAADAAALAELEAGGAREHHVGRDADAADDEVGRELAPALRDDARDALVALEPLDLVGVDDPDAALGEDAAEERADLPAEAALHRLVLEHHDRHLLADRAQRRGDLAADVRPADADDVLGAVELARGSRRRCRTRAGSGCRRAGCRRPAAGAPSTRWRPARARSRPSPWSRASPRAPRCRASSRSCASSARPARRRTSRPPGGSPARGPARRAGTPSSAAGGRRADRARARRAARCRRSRRSTSSLRGRGGGDSATDQEDVNGAIGHVRTLSRRMLALA